MQPRKPHLWFRSGWWICGITVLAKGLSPQKAYENWAKEVGLIPQVIR